MVDVITWEQLTPEQKRAFESLESRFVESVLESHAKDGDDFVKLYHVEEADGYYFITDGEKMLGDIRHESEAVMRALFEEAAQNYGR